MAGRGEKRRDTASTLAGAVRWRRVWLRGIGGIGEVGGAGLAAVEGGEGGGEEGGGGGEEGPEAWPVGGAVREETVAVPEFDGEVAGEVADAVVHDGEEGLALGADGWVDAEFEVDLASHVEEDEERAVEGDAGDHGWAVVGGEEEVAEDAEGEPCDEEPFDAEAEEEAGDAEHGDALAELSEGHGGGGCGVAACGEVGDGVDVEGGHDRGESGAG